MRQMLAIAQIQFRMAVGSKGYLAMAFLMPLVLTLIFGVLMSGGGGDAGASRRPIVVVDEDRSFASAKLVEALAEEPSLAVRQVERAELDPILAEKMTAAGVLIPAGYEGGLDAGTPKDVQLVALPGAGTEIYAGQAIRKAVARAAGDYLLARSKTGGSGDAAKLAAAYAEVLREREQAGATVKAEQLMRTESKPAASAEYTVGSAALGFTVMFVMMLVFNMGGTILQEREAGTWGRLLTTPTGRLPILLGYLISFFVTGLFQFTVLVFATRLLFHVNWGPLLPLYVMGAVLSLCSSGLGLFLAGIVRTADQQRTVGTIVVVATSMLGGVYWPLEYTSRLMQRIGYLTPQAWAMEGFREVMLRGGSWGGLMMPVTVLLALTAIFMVAGLLRVRYE